LSELSNILCSDIPREFKLMAAITHFGLIRSGLAIEDLPESQPRHTIH
jgi:hypothetical protein